MGDGELYEELLRQYKNQFGVEELGELLKQGNYKESFDCVHNTKGVTANMGLDPLTEIASAITEKLRKDEYEDVDRLYAELKRRYEHFLSLL